MLAALVWSAPSASRVTGIERWIEPLQTTRFDRQGFAAAQAQTGTPWQAVMLPDMIEMSAMT